MALPLAIGAALIGHAWFGRPSAPVPGTGASKPPAGAVAAATDSPAGAATARGPLAGLIGRWRRPDGGYVLDVAEVLDSGEARAAYYNPRPIRVARARASLRDGGRATLAVELRDVGYPGNAYDLSLDPATDRLVGTYVQPAEGQRYEVYFERQPRP